MPERRKRISTIKSASQNCPRLNEITVPSLVKSLSAIYRNNCPAFSETRRLGTFQARLASWLETERHLPKIQRRTARRLFEGIGLEEYRAAYVSVQRSGT